MACMWLGAIFVPLSEVDPASRLSSIIEDCDPMIVLTTDSEHDSLPGLPQRTGSIRVSDVPTGYEPPQRASAGDQAAYCIYTSGTTGRPKGVLIRHGAFAQAVLAAAKLLELGPDTRALCVSPFHFDGSFGTLFPTPAAGGSLVIPNRETLPLPRIFFRTVREEGITHTSFSPSYLRLLLSSPLLSDLSSSSLRSLVLGGEACVSADLELLWSAMPELRIFNRYGPTETTIAVTTFEVTPEVVKHRPLVPIGPPHPGVVFRIMDADGVEIEQAGEPGELYVGGTQLMAGYWKDPVLTKAVLRTDVITGEKLYKTGDLVFRDSRGNYTYLDRLDRVVKRSAVRISLLEVELALRTLSGVSGAVCVPFNRSGRLGIAAFVTIDRAVSELAIRRQALEWLSPTMIPDVVRVIESFPMTSASKVDAQALLATVGLANRADRDVEPAA